MDVEAIRRRVRERLATGELPLDHPKRTWAGYGTEQTCAVCDETIGWNAIEIEAESADAKYRYYHGPCYDILVEERLARG